jgi:hypothetical protein
MVGRVGNWREKNGYMGRKSLLSSRRTLKEMHVETFTCHSLLKRVLLIREMFRMLMRVKVS